MIQFSIAGRYLDLPADLSMTLKRTNMLFAFDKIECERSASFNIPATPNNDAIFQLSKMPQAYGSGMRVRYSAQMQASGVTKNGYLYVDSYAGTYKAIFVTGELLGLKAIKDAGKIGEIISPTETTQWSSASMTPAQGRNSVFAQIAYATEAEAPYPSVRVREIVGMALQRLGASWYPPAGIDYVRYIPDEPKGVTSTDVEYEAVAHAMSETGSYPDCYVCNSLTGLPSDLFYTSRARVMRTIGTPATIIYTGSVVQLRCRQALQITFPDDWNPDWFVGYFQDGGSFLLGEFAFYGEREFNDQGTAVGEPLAGRTIDVPLNGLLCVIDKHCFSNQQGSSGLEYGWGFQSDTFGFNVEGGDITVGTVLRLQDNLPDVTVTDMLKAIAALTGTQLAYDGEQGAIMFSTLGTWGETVDLTGDVLEVGSVSRTFSDYAQRNVVEFNSGDGVPEVQRLKVEYDIQNENIAEEKTLQKIPFSEGRAAGAADDRALIYTDGGALADASANVPAMTRVRLLKNASLQTLCDASTKVQIKASMTMLRFNRIVANTRFWYDGVLYVWTDLQWSKDVATLTLAKI